jgi:acylphosphatase
MARGAARLVIRGRVQGVGFRWWTEREAGRLGLDGWVRNRADGSVEVLAIGAAEAIDRLAEACRRGPRDAEVAAIEREAAEDDASQGFRSRSTV